LIELAVQIRMRLVVMDLKFADSGEQSPRDAKQYLAWSNSLQRALSRLGLEGAKEQTATLADFFAERAAREAAENAQ
jgi:hypothetical protein